MSPTLRTPHERRQRHVLNRISDPRVLGLLALAEGLLADNAEQVSNLLPDRIVNWPHVQLLYLADRPTSPPTRDLIEQTGRELRIELDPELIAIDDERSAHRARFLGSPMSTSTDATSSRRPRSH